MSSRVFIIVVNTAQRAHQTRPRAMQPAIKPSFVSDARGFPVSPSQRRASSPVSGLERFVRCTQGFPRLVLKPRTRLSLRGNRKKNTPRDVIRRGGGNKKTWHRAGILYPHKHARVSNRDQQARVERKVTIWFSLLNRTRSSC